MHSADRRDSNKMAISSEEPTPKNPLQEELGNDESDMLLIDNAKQSSAFWRVPENGDEQLLSDTTSVRYKPPRLLLQVCKEFQTQQREARASNENCHDPQRDERIRLAVEKCKKSRFLSKRKLLLGNMFLTSNDIPLDELMKKPLTDSLTELSLTGNHLVQIPAQLVSCLSGLKSLDLSWCKIEELPKMWLLPKLKRLDLSHNLLKEFPDQTILEGLPDLKELDMYGNRVSTLIFPTNPNKCMPKLESLNLGYNDLASVPEDLAKLKVLRTLKLMNNLLETIPRSVCEMKLKAIDASCNPLVTPPIDICDTGIAAMRRFYSLA